MPFFIVFQQHYQLFQVEKNFRSMYMYVYNVYFFLKWNNEDIRNAQTGSVSFTAPSTGTSHLMKTRGFFWLKISKVLTLAWVALLLLIPWQMSYEKERAKTEHIWPGSEKERGSGYSFAPPLSDSPRSWAERVTTTGYWKQIRVLCLPLKAYRWNSIS